jgi:ABC-type multidrug transport system fused ATPase/permease subunit
MGFVQQEPTLFNLSIRDNIAYGDNTREITQDQIEAAAQMANIHQFIISLPEVYSFFSLFYLNCSYYRDMKHYVEQKVANYQADKNNEVSIKRSMVHQ